MSKGIKLIGTDKVLKNLNKQVRRIKGQTTKGMRIVVLLIKGRSIVKSPVDTGNLRASHFSNVTTQKNRIIGIVGATAFYAFFVHEDLEASHKVGQAKFLEDAIKESKGEILSIIKKFAKV